MRRLWLAALGGLISLVVLTGPASATHDARARWAGNWTTAFTAEPTSGTIAFRLVSDAEGRAALAALGVAACAEPSDYYVGTYSRGTDRGQHAACTSSSGSRLFSTYRSSANPRPGQFTIDLAQSRAAFTGTFTFPGDTRLFPFSGTFAGHFSGDGAGQRGCPSEAVQPGAPNEVRVLRVRPEAEYRGDGGNEWCPLRAGVVLKAGHEINVDPDGSVVLQFADNSTVTVGHTSQLRIVSFFTEGGIVRTELLLKAGEVASKVEKDRVTRSDFRVRSPTAGTSVRGTDFSVLYDPGAKATVVSVREGAVAVDPARFGLATVALAAAKEVEVTSARVSAVAAIGRAGTPPGAVSRTRARDLVMRLIARNDERCRADVRTYSLRPMRRGWRVSVLLAGGARGWTRWNVIGSRVTAANQLAFEVGRGCR